MIFSFLCKEGPSLVVLVFLFRLWGGKMDKYPMSKEGKKEERKKE